MAGRRGIISWELRGGQCACMGAYVDEGEALEAVRLISDT